MLTNYCNISMLYGYASVCKQNLYLVVWISQNYLIHILLEILFLLLQQAVTLLRLTNSILPILSDLFLMKLNNSFICYVISFPSDSTKTLTLLKAKQQSCANVDSLSSACASLILERCFSTFLCLTHP